MGLIVCTLNVFAFVFDVITFPIYVVLQRPWNRRKQSRRIKAKAISSDSTQITYRSVDKPKKTHVEMLQSQIDTVEKMFKYATKLHPSKRCLGTRDILAEEDEMQADGKVFKKFKLGNYRWLTYTAAVQEAQNFGRGARELGIQPRERVALFAETRAEWMISAQGLFKHSCAVVTVYATLSEDGVAHALNETEVTTVITSHELMPKIRNILKMLPKLQQIIFFEDQLHATDVSGLGEIKAVAFKEVLELGKKSNIADVPPEKEDIAIIMYTSGSTGVPKGVLLTHENIITVLKHATDLFEVLPDDVFIAFLPLAHVFELVAESVCLLAGVPIGYSSANTLIDTSTKVMKGCKGDAGVLIPTAMTAVPLILDRISKGITDKVNNNSAIQKAIFTFAYGYKTRWTRRGYGTPLIDAIVFKKVAQLLGGKIRLLVSGGAPLSMEVQEKIKTCLCIELLQGYGLTETTAATAVCDRWDLTFGRVGPPVGCVDARLLNWEEGGYKVSNKPYPQGEILIGGKSVSPGYFKQEEKTKEEFFSEDGRWWFRTGDIGEIHPDGSIKIIDRKKDLVKLQTGEYVSLGKVETEMKTNPLVENICVYADPMKNFCVALVVPVEKSFTELAAKMSISGTIEELCQNKTLEKAVLREITEHGKKFKLLKTEIPLAITLCAELWTPDNGLVTASFKIKRKEIENRFKSDIQRMYSG